MNNDTNIDALKAVLSNSHDWTGYATLAILAGIILELAVLLIFAHEISLYEKIALVIANILIAAGLYVEYVYGGRGAEATAKLQRISEEKVAQLGKETAEANARTKEAELALAKFRAPRRLNSEQQALFVAKLKRFSGTEYDLAAKDDEPLDLALDIERALKAAGWNVRSWTDGGIVTELPGRSYLVGTVVLSGVDVQIRDPNLSPARDALVDVLKLSGFEGVRGSIANVPPGTPNRKVVHIMIGTKK